MLAFVKKRREKKMYLTLTKKVHKVKIKNYSNIKLMFVFEKLKCTVHLKTGKQFFTVIHISHM